MPNWCRGTLKIRGKRRNLERFFFEGLVDVPWPLVNTGKNVIVDIDNEEELEFSINQRMYIPHTKRGFVLPADVYLGCRKDEVGTIAVEAQFAWYIEAEQLLECCKELDLDMRIYAFERGLGFNIDIIIENG